MKKYRYPPTKSVIIALTRQIRLEQVDLGEMISSDCSHDASTVVAMPTLTLPFPKWCTQLWLERELQRRQTLIQPKAAAIKQGLVARKKEAIEQASVGNKRKRRGRQSGARRK